MTRIKLPNLVCGGYLFLLLVGSLPAACGPVLPWPDNDASGSRSETKGLSKLGKLDLFREALLKAHGATWKNATQHVSSQITLKSALFSAIVQVKDLSRQDVSEVLIKLLSSKEGLCGGAECSRVLGIRSDKVDDFLDQAYSAAQRSKSLNPTNREIILRTLRRSERSSAQTQIFGHRGASAFYPENSLSSVKAALESMHGAEIDIQLSRDNVPFVLHDDTLRRTAEPWADNVGVDGKRFDTPVADLAWNEIKSVSIGPRGEKVPTLKAVLDELGRHPGKGLLVEIKSYGEGDKVLEQRMIAALNQTLSEVPPRVRQQVTLISFNKEVLRLTKSAASLKELDCYWLLSASQIEEAASQGKIADILAVAKQFSGLDIESGPYLNKLIDGKNKIIEMIQKENRKVIVWISRRQRTDGLFWLEVARSLGVDIFTSDLPLDILFPARREARAKEVASILKRADPSRSVSVSSEGSTILLGNDSYGFYAPMAADFRGLSPDDREKALLTDINHLRADTRGVVVSLADLTKHEGQQMLAMLRRLPPTMKDFLKVVTFNLPKGAKDPSVIDVQSAKERLNVTRGAQGQLQPL